MPPEPDPLSDMPLFRELQRVLMSSSGPINLELARQVGVAVATWGGEDPEPDEPSRRAFDDAVRMAEIAVADLTELPAPAEVTRVEVVRRAQWVAANVQSLKGMFEPGARRLAAILDEARQEQPEEQPPPMLGAMLGQLTPLLMGSQLGTALGNVAQRALGQYDLPLPRGDGSGLLFVVANVRAFEREWNLPPVDFRAWVALHETTHAFGLSRPWVHGHVQTLLRELAEGMRFDLSGLESRLAGLDLSDPERLSEALKDPAELLGQEVDEEQRLRMRRLQAFVAAAEGHASHVMQVVGSRILPAFAQIDEAMRRRHEERVPEERVVEQLLGVEVEPRLYRLGRAFCDRVTELTDEATLSRMWDEAGSLPSLPELEEPSLWLARTV